MIVNDKKINDFLKFLKKQNKDIILAHGVFDLIHIGHIKHFNSIKKYKKNSLFIVSITSDRHVNKGINRPYFNEEFRSELLSNIKIIDHVIINNEKTPLNLLSKIKPKIYLKGEEYKKKDITGNIDKETSIVKKNGGNIIFTKDITFSSSVLINKNFLKIDENYRQKIINFKKKEYLHKITQILDDLKKCRISIIGETIIDEYIQLKPRSKLSKENIISNEKIKTLKYQGGAFAIANYLSNFIDKLQIFTNTPDKHKIKKLKNIIINKYPKTNNNKIIKTRYLDYNFNNKLFAVYSVPSLSNEKLGSSVKINLDKFDKIIINDFGHGLINGTHSIKNLKKYEYKICLNVQTNSFNYGFNLLTKYRGLNPKFICIDENEARLAVSDNKSEIDYILKKLHKLFPSSNIIITRGKLGSVFFSKNKINHVPVLTETVVDTMGAGDIYFATASLFCHHCEDLELIAFISNLAAGLKANILGHSRSITKIELLKYAETILKI